MKNVSLDRTTVLQSDADGTDGALDAAADCHVLRNDEITSLCERGVALCSTLPASEDNNHAQDRRGITGSGAWDRFEGRDD
jgi:hypothetical protein